MAPKLYAVAKINEECPSWVRSPWATRRLIRDGKMAAVRIGRALYVTDEILAAFVADSTTQAVAK